MAAPADPISIAAGTTVSFKVLPAAGGAAAIVLNEVQTIGAVSLRSPDIKATPLNANAERYIPGLADGQNQQIDMFWKPDDPGQESLRLAVQARKTVEITIQPPDVSQQIRYNLTLLGHDVDTGKVDTAKMRMVTGRIASQPIFEANAGPAYTAFAAGP